MINRRELLALGGVLGGLDAPQNGGGAGQLSERSVKELTDALKAISDTLAAQKSFESLAPVRKSQHDYLRANGKYPDFIDVGLSVWTEVYDWHVRMQQPLVAGRDPNGRYTLMLGFTVLVLRPDSAPAFIGIPYDNR